MSKTQQDSEPFVYRFRPRMIAAECEFRLGAHSLEWTVSRFQGRVAYPMIGKLRLGYRPSNLGTRRFIAEIWPRNGSRVEIASSSQVSLLGLQDHGPQFTVFMRELHRRIAASGADCTFEAGIAAWRWWPLVFLTAIMAVALAYVGVQSLLNREIGGAAIIALFLAVLVWQMGPMILRNRPRYYRPDRIPDDVLPNP